MKVDTIKRILAHRPFKPINIHMASGEEVRVLHPEQIAVFPELHLVVVGGLQVGYHMLDVELIESIKPGSRNHKSTASNK